MMMMMVLVTAGHARCFNCLYTQLAWEDTNRAHGTHVQKDKAERQKGMIAVTIMATPCPKSLGDGLGGWSASAFPDNF